ncbi:hypothetical protein K474DRAFT_1713525 [Panus rudis PR-1116 ss-1]|nr:hypothetical protein K474DRAFT_1713525 [Panus rudis PR-1116 ss-1]
MEQPTTVTLELTEIVACDLNWIPPWCTFADEFGGLDAIEDGGEQYTPEAVGNSKGKGKAHPVASMMKIERRVPAEVPSQEQEEKKTRTSVTNQDALDELDSDSEGFWVSKVTPTYLSYIGSLDNPFLPNKAAAQEELLKVLKELYLDLKLTTTSPSLNIFFRVAQQRKQEAFNCLAVAGLKVLYDFFDSDKETFPESKSRAEFAAEMLAENSDTDVPFVWHDFSSKVGLFMHPFIMKTLASYFQKTAGAIFHYGYPRGSLLLSVLALGGVYNEVYRIVLEATSDLIPEAYELKIAPRDEEERQDNKSIAARLVERNRSHFARYDKTTNKYSGMYQNIVI